jgi:class 3 adenylate cyclase
MPVYMDRHEGVTETPQETAEAHLKDIRAQAKYGVKYLTYWIDERTARAFCLVDAPSKEAAEAVHREAHDAVANEIIEVDRPVVEDFMGSIAETPAAIDPSTTDIVPGLRTILFTDMEGSTAITQRLGDAKAMELLRTHNALIRDALNAHSGREVKHTGDGIMASFVSASGAVECAIAIQKAFTSHNEQNSDTPIRVRIGLTAGEPVLENQDLFGAAVQLARRICDCAEPSEILVANVMRELCIGKGFLFTDRGLAVLKGFEDPVRVHEVSWQELSLS